MAKIKYRKVPKAERTNKRQKYEVLEDILIETKVRIGNRRVMIPGYMDLSSNGDLFIKKGYRCDGASFFLARMTKKSARAVFTHDCGYQLMREGLLSRRFRKAWDKEMHRIGLIDGMCPIEIGIWYHAVRLFAGNAAKK